MVCLVWVGDGVWELVMVGESWWWSDWCELVAVCGSWWWLVGVGGNWWWSDWCEMVMVWLVWVGDGVCEMVMVCGRWWWLVKVVDGWWELMIVDGWWELVIIRGSWWWLGGVDDGRWKLVVVSWSWWSVTIGGVGVILFYVSLQWIERFGGECLDKVRRNGQADTQTCRHSVLAFTVLALTSFRESTEQTRSTMVSVLKYILQKIEKCPNPLKPIGSPVTHLNWP